MSLSTRFNAQECLVGSREETMRIGKAEGIAALIALSVLTIRTACAAEITIEPRLATGARNLEEG